MRLLPDTHALLWLLDDDPRLGKRAARLLTDPANEVLLSAAVVWEVAIKRSLEKLVAPDGFASLLLDAGASSLAVTVEHAWAVQSLPWHHRDPFDRLLVAQAKLERAVLVSGDERMSAYDVRVEW
ncbi:MAG TPA: type II toxin-antitoxin system VapC family toxin [Solirubrobacteraceae bacterium]|nr:type II toxin-antitoxin system VapC family toxin [Solirubrobacteraceae bacterium]